MTLDVLSERFPEAGLEAGALDERPIEATFPRFITEEATARLERYAAAEPDRREHLYAWFLPVETVFAVVNKQICRGRSCEILVRSVPRDALLARWFPLIER
jgi:hypothetical protein